LIWKRIVGQRGKVWDEILKNKDEPIAGGTTRDPQF
jgi:hypothetical protein